MRSTTCFAFTKFLAVLVAALVCTGPALARVIDVPGSTGETGISLRSQGAVGVELRYEMGLFAMEPLTIDGATAQAICLPGVFLPNNAGAPNLAGMGRFVALPQGATATFEITSARTQRYHDIDVAPAPVIPWEHDDSPLVYERDPAIYTRDAFYPESPVMLSEPHMMRGVDLVTLGITPFQYNPVTRELIVYTELEVRVDFHNGNGRFGEDRLRNRYWEPILENHLLNYAALPEIDFNAPRGNRYGYEYVIITPDHADFIAWGDTLKAWRKLQGISTEVFTTTDIGGTSAEAIEDWLNDAYAWEVPPVAFLILGDYPGSGDGARDDGITSPTWNSYCVSDNIYADVDEDELPEMAHGRITARDAGELEIMIEKMLTYEKEPYTDAGFYDHPIIAGGWQSDRWFILCAETIYGHQTNVLGNDPIREYAICSGAPGSVWSTNPNTHLVVDYFGPDGLGYIPATPEHLTDWGGNAARINNDINAGAYILLHRDHGWYDGWGEPAYGNGDLAGLYNDMYPFVFSINCLTGMYNWENECFTEAFHRMEHGALGLVSASQSSYSFVNDTFVWGMFDGIWPGFMPDYNPDNVGAPILRTAFGMTYGKYFLETSGWPSNQNQKAVTYHLFHHHGDAFMTLYSEMPQQLSVIHYDVCPLNAETFAIQADAGALIGLTVDGEIIGAADATGAPQMVTIIPQTQPGALRITITKANHIRYDVTIPIGGTACVVKPDGTGDFPTIQAAIDAAVTGNIIELTDGTFTGDGNRDLDYLGKAITVRSQSTDPEACIIDCEGSQLEPHRGFYFHSSEGAGAELAGVTITNGYAAGSFPEYCGGGIICLNSSSPKIDHCIFLADSAAVNGGGLACLEHSAPALTNCVFSANFAQNNGGGMLCNDSQPALAYCTFTGNQASDGDGGAICGDAYSGALENCTFSGNLADERGGGVFMWNSSLPTLGSCTFSGNSANQGGGISACLNSAPTLNNTIVAFGTLGEAVHCDGGSATLTCCDLYGNAGGDWTGYIADQYGQEGNISINPVFCDPGNEIFTICSASPCAPENNSECGLIGAWPVGCYPDTVLVAADGSGDYPTIQAAIDDAEFGTVIELANGTYSGDGNRDIDYGGKVVTVRSASGDPDGCVIDCEGSEPEPHQGFYFHSGEVATSVLEGVTISNGYAAFGGGVRCSLASPTLMNVVFSENSAVQGGGGLACVSSAPIVAGCTFAGNSGHDGGGLYCDSSSPPLTSCTFSGNSANSGGGIYCQQTSLLTMENTIMVFSVSGEAVYCDATSGATLTCCDVHGNAGGDWVGCLEGQHGIGGNFSEDPFFCDPDNGIFSLYDDSPCAPGNNPECGLVGAWPIGCHRPFSVNPEGTGDYPTIQAAIDSAFTGIVIELADGVYTGDGNRDLNFRGKSITVRSQSGNPDSCIIDCEAGASEMRRGFIFYMGEGPRSTVQGLTILNGRHSFGGGVFCQASSPTIVNCVFVGNTAMSGGGMYISHFAFPAVTNCTFSDNTATISGGGLFINDSSNVVLENIIVTFSIGAEAIDVFNSTPTLSCCDLYGNEGGDWTGYIADQYGVDGNISADPIFCDRQVGDYTINEISPCAPDNSPAGCGLIGALGIGCADPAGAPEDAAVPTRLSLASIAPSTFHASTRIIYAIPGHGTARVKLSVYDLTGRLVHTLVSAEQPGGTYAITWDGTYKNGAKIPGGVYFCRLSCNGRSETRSLVFVK